MTEPGTSVGTHTGNSLSKTFDRGSILKKLIRVFRSNNVVKHHFQSGGTARPEGTAKAFFKNAYSFQSSVIPGYSAYDRFARYSDYAEMEAYPVLSNALNIFADEVMQKNEDGKIIQVNSEDKEIQQLLQELFDNVLHLNGKVGWKMVRNLLKYGDTFYLLDVTPENGVVNLIRMPANEVEREEGFDRDDPTAIRFRWTAKQNIEIPNAYVAHFRLDGNDLFHPYGQCLKFDTKILTKDGIKEIQHITKNDYVVSFDINNQKQIFAKVLDTVNSGKKQCFKIKTKHNLIEASKEHKILVYRNDEFKYVSTEKLLIGDKLIISKNHKTENNKKIDKTKPQNNKNGYWNNVDLIPDIVDKTFARFFGFMVGGGWIHNDNTITFAWGEHDEINQFYQTILESYTGKKAKYSFRKEGEFITNPNNISSVKVGSKMLSTILKRMGFVGNVYSKRIPDWVFSASKEIRASFLEGFQDADGSQFIDKWNCTRYQIELANEGLVKDLKTLAQSLGYKSSNVSERNRGLGDMIEGVEVKSRKDSFYFYYYKSELSQSKKQDIKNRKTNEFIVEPILSIEESTISDVYDIHVDDENHNFYANGVVVHNSVLEAARRPWRQLVLLEDSMMVYRITRAPERRVFFLDVAGIPPENIELVVNKFNETLKKEKVVDDQGRLDLRYGATMSVEEDYIIPVRGNETGTRIDTLPGGQNLGDIEDIEFIRANLFSALGIPKAFLTFDQDVKSKQVLTQEDIRFARTVSRVQEVIISELIKIAMIHLYVKGKRGKDLVNFGIKMTNPSTVAELQKMELWRARMELVMSAKEGVFDTTFIYKNFLKLSDDAIEKIKKGQIQDKMFQAKLLQIENAQGMMPGGMGMDMGMGGMGMGGGMGMMGGGLGGASPEMGGMPPVPGANAGFAESNRQKLDGELEEVLTETEEELEELKDLTRDSSGDYRHKEKRGLVDLSGAGDPDSDPNDLDGIRRTITSPMGGRESYSPEELQELIEKKLNEQLKKFVSLAGSYGDKQNISMKSSAPMGINENQLEEVFGEDAGQKGPNYTQKMLKENRRQQLEILNEKMEWEDQLQKMEEESNKLIKEVYKLHK